MGHIRAGLAIGAFVVATAVAARMTPAALLLSPAKPGAGFENPAIRIESLTYPRHAIDADDVRVTVARPVRRVVSQDWAIDEYLYSIVPPERIVGVSESATARQISNVYAYAERFHPIVATDPEAVVRANPDLILVSSSSRVDFSALMRIAGIPVYRMHASPTTLAEIADQMVLVGYLTGEDESAASELARFRASIQRAAARRRTDTPRPRVLGLGGRYSYGAHTLFHDVLRVLGATNIAAERGLKGYDALSAEQIVRWNPDWIVAGADRGRASDVLRTLLRDPAIAGTAAALNGQIVVLEHHVFLPLSPFTRLLVDALADAFYGRAP